MCLLHVLYIVRYTQERDLLVQRLQSEVKAKDPQSLIDELKKQLRVSETALYKA